MGVDTWKNGVIWKVTLKRLSKFLGPFDFFVGDCMKILPRLTPYTNNQLGIIYHFASVESIHGPLSKSSFLRSPYQNM